MPGGKIFISYRRGVDNGVTGRLHDRLERHFEKDQLFIDVDDIPLGRNFAEYLDEQVASCDAFLAVIGQGWLDTIEELQSEQDFIRIEIESALRRPTEIPIIPVFMDDARMPDREELPDSLREFTLRSGIVVPHDAFAETVDGRLTRELKSALDSASEAPMRRSRDPRVSGAMYGAGDEDDDLIRPDPKDPIHLDARAKGLSWKSHSLLLGVIALVIVIVAASAWTYCDILLGPDLPVPHISADHPVLTAPETSRNGLDLSATVSVAPHHDGPLASITIRTLIPEQVPQKPPHPPEWENLPNFKDCEDCPEMVVIPAGTFMIGSPSDEEGREDYETLQRDVKAAEFALARTEVTFDQWQACVDNGGCQSRRMPKDSGWGRGDRPVIDVSWSNAQEYIHWLNSFVQGDMYRLPSEIEWEIAARAGTTTPFAFGETISTDRANYNGSYI